MAPKGKLQIAALVMRVCLGAWFVDSGVRKIFVSGLDRFTVDVANYRLVGEPWDAVVAYTLPWMEGIAGMLLVLGVMRKGAILSIAAMVAAFSVGVFWAWTQGLDISCGCRGGDEPMNYWLKAGEFLVYWVVLGVLWVAESRRNRGAGGLAGAAG